MDVWSAAGVEVHTGSAIDPNKQKLFNSNPSSNYILSMPNLKQKYNKKQTARFRLYVREKNWSPNIYTRAVSQPETLLIESASYKITRLADELIVIDYGTSSTNHTVTSYDIDGNYFDLIFFL
jgi:hypothetical protein